MSYRKGNTFVIKEEKPQQCDLCGKIAELRPYGPNGACICFVCGSKPEMVATVKAAMERAIGDINIVVDLRGLQT